MSLPARERGLKLTRKRMINPIKNVAPRAGAWIETYSLDDAKKAGLVAPRAGAWIETDRSRWH